jgi:hypothetical protein
MVLSKKDLSFLCHVSYVLNARDSLVCLQLLAISDLTCSCSLHLVDTEGCGLHLEDLEVFIHSLFFVRVLAGVKELCCCDFDDLVLYKTVGDPNARGDDKRNGLGDCGSRHPYPYSFLIVLLYIAWDRCPDPSLVVAQLHVES